jgi:hypothetical protein
MLAERFGTALSGNTYFVVIGNHLYSAAELRKALYRSGAVFVVGRPGLSLHWKDPKVLVISCASCEITKDTIQKQKWFDKGVSISCDGFP